MRKLAFLFALAAFTAFLLITTPGNSILAGAGNWLVVTTPIHRVDLIAALGGDRARQEKSVELLRAGIASHVVFLGADARQRDYECLGVPISAAVPIPPAAYTTGEEAERVFELVRSRGYRSLLIVTAPSHSRRALWIFHRKLRGTGVDILVATTESAAFRPEKWWISHMGQKTVLGEYLGLGYYRVREIF